MKTIIKIAIAVALANAAVRVGLVAMSYYQLKDAAQQEVTFGSLIPTAEIATHIIEKASELGVPLDPESLEVRRDGDLTLADASYTQPVELFPSYVYRLELSFSVQARTMVGLR
jgi:type III secretion system FlhB-like substrate exporter